MEISLQAATLHQIENGVKIYVLNSDEFEVLRLSFVFNAGTVMQHKPFVASATANLLSEGSSKLSAQQIAEGLDFYGSYYDVNIDRDYTYISFCSLTKFVKPTLDMAAKIILDPTFAQSEVETYCAKRKQRLEVERRRVETRAREEFAISLFGDKHPYGISSPTAAYDDITREDIVEFHRRHYTADNCFIVCSGRVTEQELEQIKALAAAMPRHKAPSAPHFPALVQRKEFRAEQQGAVQSSIRIGRELFERSHPDFIGMQVVATILGGYFGSRLMQSLREERGYTYGVVSALVNFAHSGYIAIATQVGCEVADDALQVIYTEIERLRTELISDDELTMVKHIMAGEMMRILDGPFGVADVTIENILCSTDNSALAKNLERIESITAQEVMRLSQKYLRREDLVTTVVG